MNRSIWLSAVGIIAALFVGVRFGRRWLRRRTSFDVGAVSEGWLAQERGRKDS